MKWFELPSPDPAAPPPAFHDLKGARAWLAEQPQAMPNRVQTAVAEQLELLAGSGLPAFDRARLLEALRGPAVTAQNALRRRFAFQPRPLAGDAVDTFTQSVRLWNALATGYLQCLEAFADDYGRDRQRLATAVHRALRTCRSALEDHFVAGVEAPPELWYCLQRLIQAASELGVADIEITDPEYRSPAASTPAEQYVLVALLALADPYRWLGPHFAVAERAFLRWRSNATLAAASDNDPKLRWVPLSAIAELPPSPAAASPAWLEVHGIRRKLRRRIEKLDAGESAEALHLGRDLSEAACRDLLDSILDHLRAAYSEAGDKLVAVNTDCELAVGAADCYRLLNNRPFVGGQTLSSTSARILHERVAVFGAADRVEGVAAPIRCAGEIWHLDADAADAALISLAPGDARSRVLPGQLALIRDTRDSISLAVVARLWVRQNGRTEARLRRLPGRPEAYTGHAIGMANEAAFPLLLLPEVASLGSPASLLLPSGLAMRFKKGVETRGEAQRRYTLGKLIERGTDFERYAYTAA